MTVRAALVQVIPDIFARCIELENSKLEYYLYDRMLEIVLRFLKNEENMVNKHFKLWIYRCRDIGPKSMFNWNLNEQKDFNCFTKEWLARSENGQITLEHRCLININALFHSSMQIVDSFQRIRCNFIFQLFFLC